MADFEELAGESSAMVSVRTNLRRLLNLARDRGRLPAILIQGETGTGKGLVARLLHRHGPRAGGPFVDLNCAAIPEALLEGELFGYERGAYTDARRSKPGLFQVSTGGLLFLDEVALLPPAMQAKLLTAIEERAVRRLGGTTKERFDTWLISATNADLVQATRERRFREDLYHRLAVLTIDLPPLRERGGDAVLLAQRFLDRACTEYGVAAKVLATDARALVARSPWPGNVRELGNAMERLALLVDGSEVRATDLEATLRRDRSIAVEPTAGMSERDQILAALEATGWNIMRTAARLGISRNTMRARMDRWGLRPGREASAGLLPTPETAPPRVADAIPTPVPAAVAAPGPARWERRHVTLLRVTLAGRDDLSVEAGQLLSLAAEKAIGFGGRTEALGRASFDVSFGVVPIENATRRAVGAALAVHRAVDDAARPGVAVTTVVHTALATIGRAGGAVMIDEADGPAFAAALSRLRERARPGAVHVSAATAPFVERHFELQADESPDPMPSSFTVVRRDPTGMSGRWRQSRFVDREAELELLRARWDLARQGRGQMVGLVGEAGAGKSRLLREFTAGLDPAALRLHVLLAPSEDPSRSRPANLLLGLIFGLQPEDTAPEIRDKLVQRLAALDLDETLLAPLAALLEVEVDDAEWVRLDPPRRARRMLDALRRVIIRESLARPLAVVVEDLHWIDPDTEIALDSLMEAVPSARILVVLAYRPEYRHGWTDRTFYTQLRVDALPPAAADELLGHLLGEASEATALRRQLTAWTEGNPFFLEECVRTLAETGVLSGTPGAFRVTVEGAAPALPDTVEDTLAARIHRLSADARHVLQCAAAIGTDFGDTVLAAVSDVSEDVLDRSLRTLEEAEFVYPHASSRTPARTFKHALTHLVAYRSVPAERQRALHARILGALETLPPGQPGADAEALAEHAVRGERWRRAVDHLRDAGMRALARSANRAAADYFERALAALDHTDDPAALADLAIDLRLDLRHALTPLGEVDRILRHLRDAETIAERIGDRRRLGRVLSFQTNGLFSQGDHVRAIECGRRALLIARDLDDLSMAIAAEQFVGRALHAQGSYRAAIEIFGRIAASLTGGRATENLGLPVSPAVFARSHLVWCHTELGEFAEAERFGQEAVTLAESIGQPEALQWAYYSLGLLALDRGELDTAVRHLERVLSICRGADLPVYMPRTSAAWAHAQVLLGQGTALAALEQAVADAERRRQVNVHASALTRLAEVYLHVERIEDAGRTAEQAVDLARKRGERGTEARALRMQAEAQRRGSPPRLAEAEASCRAALALAEDLEAQPQLVLGRLETGRLLHAMGRGDDARVVLREAETTARHLGLSRVVETVVREGAPPSQP